MSKEKRIIDIKSVQDFYKALRDEVANLFNGYEKCGIFDGWTEQQKKECFGFGTHILSIIYNPIQKRYTKQERKKYEKIVNDYEEICKLQGQQIAELEERLKNAIVPKFKYGQDVWCVYPTNEHRQGFVFELEFVGYTKDKIICCITENEEFEYDEVFETKEEAEAKLQELQEK